MLTAIFVTRVIFDYLLNERHIKKLACSLNYKEAMQLINPDINVDFVAWRNKAFMLSGTIVLVGMIRCLRAAA